MNLEELDTVRAEEMNRLLNSEGKTQIWKYDVITRKQALQEALANYDFDNIHKKETAKEVAKSIRLGERIERVTAEYVRTADWLCSYHRKKATSEEVIDRLSKS